MDSPDGSWLCLQHFNSSSASLLPTWGLAGFGVLQPDLLVGISHLPPTLFPFLPFPLVMDLFL